MKNAFSLLLVLFSVFPAFGSRADFQPPTLSNDSLRSLVLKQLKLSKADCKEELFSEKILPYSKTETVMVIPKMISEEEGMFTIDAIIVVVNNQTGKITQRCTEENLLDSDAVQITGFTVDTAPFVLSEKVRAFGIRVNYGNTSSINPYRKCDISLYVQEGNKLRRIFGEYEMNVENAEKGLDCNGQYRYISKTIAMDTESSYGYFNLVLIEKISMVISEEGTNGDCIQHTTEAHQRKTILYYNGKTYNWEIEW